MGVRFMISLNLLAVLHAVALAFGQDEGPSEALKADDECAVSTEDSENGCGLSALQLRGVRASPTTTTATRAQAAGTLATSPAPSSSEEVNSSTLNTAVPDEVAGQDLGAQPARSCQTVVDRIKQTGIWKFGFYNMDLSAQPITSSAIAFSTWEDVSSLFHNHDVMNIQISRTDVAKPCETGWRQSLWFYPREDWNAAFDLNDFVCSRMAAAARVSGAACINIYRVNNVAEINNVLVSWPTSGIIDVTFGGHGNNDPNGVLGLGAVSSDHMGQDTETAAMLQRLANLMLDGGIVFLDSCYSAINGMAPYISKLMPKVWVMGGIVSLDSEIDMLPGSSGPLEILSDFPTSDSSVPSFQAGTQAIKVFGAGQDMGMAWNFGAPAFDPNPAGR